MSRLRVPIVSVVIGEGGSGGALAIGVCDRLLMLQYSIYSVISPEGCASILWRAPTRKNSPPKRWVSVRSESPRLGLVDEVLKEPLGGAHRDPQAMADTLKEALLRASRRTRSQSVDELLRARQAHARLRSLSEGVITVAPSRRGRISHFARATAASPQKRCGDLLAHWPEQAPGSVRCIQRRPRFNGADDRTLAERVAIRPPATACNPHRSPAAARFGAWAAIVPRGRRA